MSAAKHTPGPWIVGRDGNDERRFRIVKPGALSTAMPIAVVYNIENGKPFGMERVEMSAAGNALLIAAAPDLLAACEEMSALFPEDKPRGEGGIGIGYRSAVLKIRAAIAKATSPGART